MTFLDRLYVEVNKVKPDQIAEPDLTEDELADEKNPVLVGSVADDEGAKKLFTVKRRYLINLRDLRNKMEELSEDQIPESMLVSWRNSLAQYRAVDNMFWAEIYGTLGSKLPNNREINVFITAGWKIFVSEVEEKSATNGIDLVLAIPIPRRPSPFGFSHPGSQS